MYPRDANKAPLFTDRKNPDTTARPERNILCHFPLCLKTVPHAAQHPPKRACIPFQINHILKITPRNRRQYEAYGPYFTTKQRAALNTIGQKKAGGETPPAIKSPKPLSVQLVGT
ncbi:hypothetical protein AA106556_0128 [Neokomagataea tanensis NBRC 106556]|uniref:Uncharacterized protein n=1 Tax=Neokomagataea tanensis NBRC 106556 TaxID=1223519 RepID=A0ABQ0QG44_9PROT|nr:hypothetical protein AA106556_0128 [Neokomagataea tanensis NBRC 106556]